MAIIVMTMAVMKQRCMMSGSMRMRVPDRRVGGRGEDVDQGAREEGGREECLGIRVLRSRH